MIWFWILWGFNALMSLVPIYFFFEGMYDGSIDADNMWMWVIIMGVVGLILWGTYWLKQKNQLMVAKIILWVATIPSIFAIIFMSIAIFGEVRWN